MRSRLVPSLAYSPPPSQKDKTCLCFAWRRKTKNVAVNLHKPHLILDSAQHQTGGLLSICPRWLQAIYGCYCYCLCCTFFLGKPARPGENYWAHVCVCVPVKLCSEESLVLDQIAGGNPVSIARTCLKRLVKPTSVFSCCRSIQEFHAVLVKLIILGMFAFPFFEHA